MSLEPSELCYLCVLLFLSLVRALSWCCAGGDVQEKVQLLSQATLHEIHIWIFTIAMVNIFLSAAVMLLALAKVGRNLYGNSLCATFASASSLACWFSLTVPAMFCRSTSPALFLLDNHDGPNSIT